MKKIILGCLLLTCCSLYAQKKAIFIDTNYNMPAFSDSSAILIDVNKINGKFGSFVRITNYSEFKTLEFEVFVHSPLSSSWESLGKKILPDIDDYADFGKRYLNLKDYRYFAIVPISDNESEYQYGIEKQDGRLDVDIYTKGALMTSIKGSAYEYVITDKLVLAGSNDKIRVYNKSSKSTVDLTVFGWDKKNHQWIQLCVIVAQSDLENPQIYEINEKKSHSRKFKYHAITTKGGKIPFNYKDENYEWTITIFDIF